MSVICGDCLDILPTIPDDSVDIVFTSPPYAERRKKVYGGVPATKYVDWFLPIASEIKRILKPTGSFFLNIKPHTKNGERSLYVFDLVKAIRNEVGFMFIEEYCWTKNAFPGNLPGRFKNGFEPVYHFALSPPSAITFNPLACGTPILPENIAKAYRKQSGAPANGSGMTGWNKNAADNYRSLELARPSNVVHATVVSSHGSLKESHPATFPEALVAFFVKSFSNEGDTVLDPFAGSGTVGAVCEMLNREFILIEKMPGFCNLINARLKHNLKLF